MNAKGCSGSAAVQGAYNVHSMSGVLLISVIYQGFDEYMNLVLEDAEEVDSKKKSRRAVGEPLTASTLVPSLPNLLFAVARRSLFYVCFVCIQTLACV